MRTAYGTGSVFSTDAKIHNELVTRNLLLIAENHMLLDMLDEQTRKDIFDILKFYAYEQTYIMKETINNFISSSDYVERHKEDNGIDKDNLLIK